jgi:hypothetical protein
MSSEVLSIGLDVVVLIVLGVTIFYAVKLTKSLNAFRSYREEFEALLDELTRNMDDAQRAIHNLKMASGDAGKNLQKTLSESRGLADELQIINESSSKLANRLEKSLGSGKVKARDYDEQVFNTIKGVEANAAKKGAGAFAIQDRDFGKGDTDTGWDMEEGEPLPEELQSQAERELYKALQKNKGKASGKHS